MSQLNLPPSADKPDTEESRLFASIPTPPSPAPVPSPERRGGLLINLAYEVDAGSFDKKARNIARFLERHPEHRNNWVSFRHIQEEIAAEIGVPLTPTALCAYGFAARKAGLRTERRQAGEPRKRRSFLVCDQANLEKSRAWVQHAADVAAGDFIAIDN
jgi:hypothetical protein